MGEARNLCDRALSTDDRRAKVRNELKIKDCKLVYLNNKNKGTNELSQWVLVVIFVAIGLVVVSGSLVVACYFKRKKRDKLNEQWGEIERLNENNGKI